MARTAKLIITASDKSQEGIDDAIRSFEKMGLKVKKVADDSNKSIIQMAKESKAQLEGINAALQLGGWLLMAQNVGRALADITKEARGNSDAFKEATSSFSALNREIGSGIVTTLEPMVGWIAKIVGRWADAARAVREYHEAQSKLTSGKELSASDKIALASGQLADVRGKIGSTTEAANIARARGAPVDVSGAIAQLRAQESALVETLRNLSLEILGKAELEKIAVAASASAAKAAAEVWPLSWRPNWGNSHGTASPEEAPSPWLQYQAPTPWGNRGGPTVSNATDGEAFSATDTSGRYRSGGVQSAGGYQGAMIKPTWLESLGNAFAPLIDMMGSLSNLKGILDPLGTIFKGMMDVLGPLIQEALQPLMDVLLIIGNTLGQILAPVIKFVGSILKWFADVVLGVINWFRSIIGLKKIDSPVASSQSTSGGSGGASYTGAQAITFNFYNQGNVVGSGGLEELAAIIDSIIKKQERYA